MISSPSATQLWQIERDGNPLRRYGQASPFTGKLGPLDKTALDQIGRLARAALPVLPQPTLVIGMTESSLLLAHFVALWQQTPLDLKFTSREMRAGGAKRAFREPHSHGPQHFLALDAGQTYAQIVIVEDELTTGATLRNLICEVADVAPRIFVLTLRDMRPQPLRDELQNAMKALGIELQVLDLASALPLNFRPEDALASQRNADFNPFGRREEDRRQAAQKLQQLYAQHAPGAIYLIGECVDLALPLWLQAPENARPELRHITRSPWKINGATIRSAQRFPGDGTGSRYFFYNFAPPQNQRALWISEASNAIIGAQVSEFLGEQNIASWGIEVTGG